MAKTPNSLPTMIVIPSAISIAVNGVAAVSGIALWRAVCKVPESLAPRFRELDPDYIANLLNRLQDSVTLIIAMAAVLSCLATIAWFVLGWLSKIDGPGVAWGKRWLWRIIGSGFFVVLFLLLLVVGYYQSLNVKIAMTQLIYQSGALLVGFLFFYWLASFLGTSVKLRPAVPLASYLPIWFSW